jgi:hypothetical protein
VTTLTNLNNLKPEVLIEGTLTGYLICGLLIWFGIKSRRKIK